MDLLIVESPKKAKQIQKMLGSGWSVRATVGHFRDLPPKKLGVRLEDGSFRPEYELTKGAASRMKEIARIARNANTVYLATDPDREGEAIAWHVTQYLGKNHAYRRVRYREVTKTAILDAIRGANEIDINLVAAQETRRVIDRLVGYQVSPLISRKFGGESFLSAGRVQSPAVRLVVEREKEIRNFKAEDYYRLAVTFPANGDNADQSNEIWTAYWLHQEWQQQQGMEKTKHLMDARPAHDLLKAIEESPCFTVIGKESREQKRKAPSPFSTSLLQQAASNKLGLSPDETMKIAQSLFEEGRITYHRTDNLNLSDEAITEIRAFIEKSSLIKKYPDILPGKPNTWKTKADAQEAHEAIRPTDVTRFRLPEGADPKHAALYELIWKRTMASQLAPARYRSEVIRLRSDAVLDGRAQLFEARGRVLLYPGWQALMMDDCEDPDERKARDEEAGDQQALPDLSEGARVEKKSVKIETHQTRPPPRYTEASLVKTLENLGIGRPSTYASILKTIKKRGYVEIKKKKLHATDMGIRLIDGMVGHFGFLEYKYTADVESRLDDIAQGAAKYKPVVAETHGRLVKEMEAFSSSVPDMPSADDGVQHTCPVCESPLRKLKRKKGGHFWACSAWKETGCDVAMNDLDGAPDIEGWRIEQETRERPIPCPKCGSALRRIAKRKGGHFWACSAWKETGCDVAMNDLDGKPDLKGWQAEQEKLANAPECPLCGSALRRIKARNGKGYFWGCSAWKENGCKAALDDIKGKPDYEGWKRRLEARKNAPPCPACGTEHGGVMLERSGKKGAFLGCSRYPECTQTLPIDDDDEPQIQCGAI